VVRNPLIFMPVTGFAGQIGAEWCVAHSGRELGANSPSERAIEDKKADGSALRRLD